MSCQIHRIVMYRDASTGITPWIAQPPASATVELEPPNMTRNGTSAGLVAVALLAALCVAPGALAQNAGTPVATPVTGSMTVVTVDQLGNALAGACYNLVSNGVLL